MFALIKGYWDLWESRFLLRMAEQLPVWLPQPEAAGPHFGCKVQKLSVWGFRV